MDTAPTPTPPMEDTGPMALTPTPIATTARGPLRPSPRLRLTPLSSTELMAMDSLMLDMPMEPTPPPTPMDTDSSTARGLLRPSLRLRLTPLLRMAPMAMDSPMLVPMEPTPTPLVATTTARGLLRLSPRPRLTPL